MWTVIIIAAIALTVIVVGSNREGDFIKGDHKHYFFMSMCCLMLTAVITVLALAQRFLFLFLLVQAVNLAN